jgi:hypothetical protein
MGTKLQRIVVTGKRFQKIFLNNSITFLNNYNYLCKMKTGLTGHWNTDIV